MCTHFIRDASLTTGFIEFLTALGAGYPPISLRIMNLVLIILATAGPVSTVALIVSLIAHMASQESERSGIEQSSRLYGKPT